MYVLIVNKLMSITTTNKIILENQNIFNNINFKIHLINFEDSKIETLCGALTK